MKANNTKKVRVIRERNLLWRGNCLTLSINNPISATPLSLNQELLQILKTTPLDANLWNDTLNALSDYSLINVRGQPTNLIYKNEDTIDSVANEEVLYITGELSLPEREDKEDSEAQNNEPKEEIFLRVKSKFSHFSKGAIVYNLDVEASSSVFETCQDFSIIELLDNKVFIVKSFRFGFELFKGTFIKNYLGIIPTIYAAFYLHLSLNEINLYTRQDDAPLAQKLPLEKVILWPKLMEKFSNYFQIEN